MTPDNFFEVGCLYTITQPDGSRNNILITEIVGNSIRCLEGDTVETYYSTHRDCRAVQYKQIMLFNTTHFTADCSVVFSRVI